MMDEIYKMIHYENKHFQIQGKKTFLYGAECHYFRIDPEDWSDRLAKIKKAGFNLVSTYVPWLWHEPQEGKFDFVGNSHPRRNLVAFLDLCMSLDLYCIVRPGPYVMSELKNEGIPEWLLNFYPEVIATTETGDLHPTRVISYLHPTYLNLVEKWYKEVCFHVVPRLITHGGSIIMFQLDNEIGMLHWVTNTTDHNKDSLQHYEQFCDKVSPIKPHSALESHWSWAEFARYYYAEYVRTLKMIAEANGIDVPFILNVHGFKDFSVYSRGVDYPIGLSQLQEAARVGDVILAGDFYPGKIDYDNFHDLLIASALTEAMGKPDQPLFSAEFQSGRLADRPRIYSNDVDLITRLCVASGMNALNYYMYCGGDNVDGIGLFGRRHEWQAPIASNGDLRPSYQVTYHLGQLFNVFGEFLCDAPKNVDTHIGFYPFYYATETVNHNDEMVQGVISEIASQREYFHFDGIWRLLSAANISYAAVDISIAELDVVKSPTLWVCTTKYMDKVTQEKLVQYLQNGGKLFLGPQIPIFDLYGEPCNILANVCGVNTISEHTGFQRVSILDIDSVFCRQYSVLEAPDNALIVAKTEDGAATNAYLKEVGNGQVLVFGIGLTHEYQYHLEVIHRLSRLMGIIPRMSVSDENVIIGERSTEVGSLISVINVDDVSRTIKIMRDGVTAFGKNTINVGPRTGKLLPVQYLIAEGIMLCYSTVEIVQIKGTDVAINVDVIVPAGDNGILCWRFNSEFQIRSMHGAEIKLESLNGDTLIYLPEDPIERRVSLQIDLSCTASCVLK